MGLSLYSENLITWRELLLYTDRRQCIKGSALWMQFNDLLHLFVRPNYQLVDRRIRDSISHEQAQLTKLTLFYAIRSVELNV